MLTLSHGEIGPLSACFPCGARGGSAGAGETGDGRGRVGGGAGTASAWRGAARRRAGIQREEKKRVRGGRAWRDLGRAGMGDGL